MKELLARFVAAFKRGIEGELAAMHASAEAFEIPLARGEDLGTLRYAFEVAPTERIAPGSVCVLRAGHADQRATIERCGDGRVVVLATSTIDLAEPAVLVVAPWFLYDRLLQALDELAVDRHHVELALKLFGKLPFTRTPAPLAAEHGELDASQRAAVQLCNDSDVAFVWGPPGTGKTVTLTHVLDELIAQDQRVLLVSTTNAAIDQVLAKLSTRPWFAEAVEHGRLIRLGRSAAETYGAELGDIVGRLHAAHRSVLERLRTRVGEVIVQLRFGKALLAELAPALDAQQSLFAAAPPRLRSASLARVFPAGLADTLAERSAAEQKRALATRIARLERVQLLAKARIAVHAAADRDLEAKIVANARVVMCTLTNAHLAPAMAGQRFDVLIAEEAGMATLPPLFYAACLCRRRAIVVGDPRQLPPIVQSDDERVHRAIGRNIFDVTIPDPLRSDAVAMLEVQYRMHPAIGALVGRLFYGDRLVHAADATATAAIAARAPFPGTPLAVVDTHGTTTCERSTKGSSRINRASAERAADLALEAVRAGTTSLGVITPYAAQAAEIRRLLAARGLGDTVECSTVHRFQGRECDMVILDLVDAAPLRPSALVTDPNLLNVSISRARGKLVIIADVAHFTDGPVATLLRG
jgi:hypothetical protein